MKKIVTAVHWVSFAYLMYAFGYASLFKVFQKETMMTDMASLGFGKGWTLVIGYGELMGVVGLIAGIWRHEIKNLATLWLFPFAIGALMVHFAHNDYQFFYTALYCSVACVAALGTDRHFRIAV